MIAFPPSRHVLALVAAAMLATLGIGCEQPKPGVTVHFDDICDSVYDPVMEKGLNVTKRVTIEGYVGMHPSMFKLCSDTCDFDLYADPAGKGKRVNADVTLGSGKNQMEKLPKNFTPEDIKIHTQDGKVVGVGAKVRITGGRAPTGDKRETCGLWKVDLIEAL
jgi:hypothetical protein